MEVSPPKSVLIVDDDEAIRKLVQRFLMKMGYACEVASKTSEALEMLRKQDFDLVISDIRMEGKDGIELMLEAQKSYPHLDFIIMTGHAAEYSYGDIIAAGAADYLVKSFEMSELSAKLQRIEREKNIIRQLQQTNKKLEKAMEQASQMATKAEAASQAKSNFLANVSHEFRTPLNAIIGFTGLVIDKHFGDLNEVQEEYLGDVLQSARHLLSLINDILDLSKVEAGKLELKLSECSLKAVLSGCMMTVREKAMKHGIRLSTDIEDASETIRADLLKLEQIMNNLLSNAVKFTPDGGKVHTSARVIDCMVRPGLRFEDPEELRIVKGPIDLSKLAGGEHQTCIEVSVSDTGIGLNEKDLQRIFKPFEQAEGITSRRYKGTGLGLSLTKRLVELHGGKIWAESEGEGKGSTFCFIIPVKLGASPNLVE